VNGQPRLDALLASYPRRRPDLPHAHSQTYVEHYRLNRSGKSGLSRIVMRLESWMHRRVARGGCDGTVLEIGAGNLNHLPYHPNAKVYDAVESFSELWHDSPQRKRVRRIYADLTDVPAKQSYACILSIAVLEHVTDLPLVLALSGILLREGGSFRAGFPSEGGLLWGLAWRLTTGIEYRLRRGLDYAAIMRHEHVNTAGEILALLRYFFGRVEVSRFPVPFTHLSFYTAATAYEPQLDRCRRLWSERTAHQPTR
jgi:hypothetical protein